MPIDPRMVKWDAEIDPAKVSWDEEPSKVDRFIQGAGQVAADVGLGALRGAGSIGATILTPIDAIARKLGVQNDFVGRDDRREAMTQATQTMGANPDSWLYGGGKLAAEIAGTAGVGNALALPFRTLTGPVGKALYQGLQSGGLRVGELAGTTAGTAMRVGTGAVTNGAAAGLVDPEYATTGAAVGGALPVAMQVVGKVGAALRGKEISPRLTETAGIGIDAGYIVPPNMVKPGPINNVIESISGKQATQQIASTQNAKVTEGLVRQALGIADDVPLTKATTESLRKTAGKAYADVSALHPMAAADNEALKAARHQASTYFTSYNRTANPEHLAIARQAQATADDLERSLEFYATQADKPGLVDALREARKQIAKTYTVDRALNDAAGTIDARVFGRLYEKGKPLSDGLDVAGRFASAFPSINKSTGQVGSPAAHNLRSIASMALGTGGYATAGPGGLLMAAAPWVAPAASRSLMFSKPVQRGLLSPTVTADEIGLLSNALRLSAPLLAAQ